MMRNVIFLCVAVLCLQLAGCGPSEGQPGKHATDQEPAAAARVREQGVDKPQLPGPSAPAVPDEIAGHRKD